MWQHERPNPAPRHSDPDPTPVSYAFRPNARVLLGKVDAAPASRHHIQYDCRRSDGDRADCQPVYRLALSTLAGAGEG